MNADMWNATMSNETVKPKGDKTELMLIASGAPTQKAVSSTESGGKNGLMASQRRGNNLQKMSRMITS